MLPSGRTPTRHVAFAPVHVAPLHWHARSRPIADELHRFVLAENQRHLPGSDVANALNYTLNPWNKILICYEGGALELDTNLVENMKR